MLNTSTTQSASVFLRNIQRGLDAQLLTLNDERSRVTYHAARNYTDNFKDPEEVVRAAYFVELVLDYKYPKERIDFEIKTKPDKDSVDIVVYADDALKSPYLIVETKKDGISDLEYQEAIKQAFRYANYLRAKYAIVVAGTTRTAFDVAGFEPSERQKNVIGDIPVKYGKVPKYRFLKGDAQKDLKVVSREELIQALEKCHDTVWQGGKLAPTAAFDEVSKLLFCKLRDEKQRKNGEAYTFQIGTYETADDVFQRVDAIYQKAKQEDEEVFKENIRLPAPIVYSVVEHLQDIAINKVDLDTKGVAFERFMQDFFKGKMGQFFTPRPLVEFCVLMLAPQFADKVIDPACGSGGFLLNTLDYVRHDTEAHYDPSEALVHWHNFAKDRLFGIEINDQIARVCKMNMIIHDDGHTNVISADSLDDFAQIQQIKPAFREGAFDLLLTNPPFGATVKATEKRYLERYDLGGKQRKTQKTEILFIERCLHFLKPETGRMAIVLPDGILTNSSLQYVREFLLQQAHLLAVVSLPQFAFSHYGAGVKSSLVFLRRKGENETLGEYPVFMAIAEHIGYDATGRDDPQNDLPEIARQFHEFQKNFGFFQ